MIRDEQPVATSLTAKEIHARSLHLDRLSILEKPLICQKALASATSPDSRQ